MAYEEAKELRIFQAVEDMSDRIWDEIIKWDNFAKFSIGRQLVDAIDSVTANMEESEGRYHYKDKLNFLYISRGSLMESRRWLTKAVRRKLFPNGVGENFIVEIEDLLPQFNSYINHRKRLGK